MLWDVLRRWATAEEFLVRDEHFVFTVFLYVLVLLFFANQVVVHSVVLGSLASVLFLFFNAVFVGCALFGRETPLVRLALGGLVLLAVLGLVGWVVMIAYNLDAVRSTIVLSIVVGVSSFLNLMRRRREGEAG